MTNAERAALPVMAPGRGDVIVAGAAVLVETMRRFGIERALVSETDILVGLAYDAARGRVAWGAMPSKSRQRHLAKRAESRRQERQRAARRRTVALSVGGAIAGILVIALG